MVSGLIARARSLWRGVRGRRAVEAEMAEEFRLHQELRAADLVAQGLTPAQAARQAKLEFGCAELHKDDARAARGLRGVDGLRVSWLDLKLGGRMLAKHPGLTAVGTLALSLAIGIGAGYLELLNDLYRPTLPGDQAARLVRLRNWDVATGKPEARALHDFLVWREQLTTVRDLGAFRPLERNLVTDDGRAEPVAGVEISASAFRLLPVPPLLGRPLLVADETPGGAAVVVIGHALWRTRFGGDSAVVGRRVRLGGAAHTVVGVMPEGFGFPVNHALWIPLRVSAADAPRGQGAALGVFGRLAPDATLDAAQAELTAVGLRAAADHPTTNRNLRPRVTRYLESLAAGGDSTEMYVAYSANVLLLAFLAVCCANVATLVFARTATREGEIAVRTALGAGRGRIVAQLFGEALVLCTVAAAVGLAVVAYGLPWATTRVVEASGASLPFWWDDRLAPATLLYATGLTVLAALLIGVVPALKATGPALQPRLKHAAGGSRMQFGRLWTGVIVAQVALTTVFLLVLASVGWNARVGRFLPPAMAVPAESFLTARLQMDGAPERADASAEDGAAFRARFGAALRELERRLESEPGVAAVTWGTRLPSMDHPAVPIAVEGAPGAQEGDDARWVRTAMVAGDFFETLEAPIVAGRTFGESDAAAGREVAIVDEAFARRVLPGRDPVGQRVRHTRVADAQWRTPGPWIEIVGVVRNLTEAHDTAATEGILYRPAARGGAYPIHVAVRVQGAPAAMAPRLRGVAVAVDPTLRLHAVVPMQELGANARLVFAIILRLLGGVGVVALLLSTAGIHALMAFTVARRTREIGIRSALGAAPGRVVASVLARASRQIGAGILLGSVPGAALVARGTVEGIVGGGDVVGLAAFLLVGAAMLALGTLASAVPVRRALRVQPTEALRAEG